MARKNVSYRDLTFYVWALCKVICSLCIEYIRSISVKNVKPFVFDRKQKPYDKLCKHNYYGEHSVLPIWFFMLLWKALLIFLIKFQKLPSLAIFFSTLNRNTSRGGGVRVFVTEFSSNHFFLSVNHDIDKIKLLPSLRTTLMYHNDNSSETKNVAKLSVRLNVFLLF